MHFKIMQSKITQFFLIHVRYGRNKYFNFEKWFSKKKYSQNMVLTKFNVAILNYEELIKFAEWLIYNT